MSFQDPQSQQIFYRKLWEEVGHFITSSSKSLRKYGTFLFFIVLNWCYKRFLCICIFYNKLTFVDQSCQEPLETSMTLLNLFSN